MHGFRARVGLGYSSRKTSQESMGNRSQSEDEMSTGCM